MKLLITGGGTGGHIYPGIAVAQAMQQISPDTQLFYVGKKGGLEETIVAKSGLLIQFFGISAQGFSRGKTDYTDYKSRLHRLKRLNLCNHFKEICV
ncbi:MAG: glycosyltransferase, partial [bacterium]|nr:glycosyltransferase [bacterium]